MVCFTPQGDQTRPLVIFVQASCTCASTATPTCYNFTWNGMAMPTVKSFSFSSSSEKKE